jgi:hypothetical protein
MKKTKLKPTLLIDTRERTPFNFDGDEDFAAIEHTKVDAGDYTLDGMQNIITIERKASADELLNNFYENKERIMAEFDLMKERGIKHKFIVVEQDLETVMNPQSYYINRSKKNRRSPMVPVAVVMENLTNLMLEHNVHVIFAGSKAAKITKRLLLRAYELHSKGKL